MAELLKKDERVSISFLLNQIVQQQQQCALWISNIASGLESIRADIRRTDENHARELDRLHDIIKTLLPLKQLGTAPTPQQVYNESAAASVFFGNKNAGIVGNNMTPPQQKPPMPVATMGPVSLTTKNSLPPVSKLEPKDDISSESSDGLPWEDANKEDNSSNTTTGDNSFGAKYILKEDQWECKQCYATNPLTAKQCACCKGTQGNTNTAEQQALQNNSIIPLAAPSQSRFSFGLNAGKITLPKPVFSPNEKTKVSFADAAKETADNQPSPQNVTRTLTDNTTFSFGAKGATSGSIFGGPAKDAKLFSFKLDNTAPSTKRDETAGTETKNGNGTSFNKSQDSNSSLPLSSKIFGSSISSGNLSFDKLNMSTTSLFDEDAKKQAHNELAKQKSSKFGISVRSEADNDQESVEEYEPTAEFTPVCPLPDLVEVVTGEEDETVLYKDRCKLYRFVKETKEWKERGIGDIKFLLNEKTGKARCVMRRDHTFKVACNFQLSSGMSIDKMPKNEKAVIWLCVDFSDGQNTEKLSARFGSAEKADEFVKHFTENCK